MRKVLDAFNQELTVDATVAGYSNPCLLRTATGFSFYETENLKVKNASGLKPITGRLKTLNGKIKTATGFTRRSWYIELVFMPLPNVLIALPCSSNIVSMAAHIPAWSGDLPCGYGYGVLFVRPITNTDVIRLAALVESEFV